MFDDASTFSDGTIQVNYIQISVFLVQWIHRWSVNWLHILCDECTRRNRSEKYNVLKWKNNEIATWMTLKSSEIHKLTSWSIKTILIHLLVSSAFRQCTLPHFIRPMLSAQICSEEKILLSPEFNRSIIFSKKTTMTKKSTQFFWHWIIGGRIILWFNIGPSSFSHKNSFSGWAGKNVFVVLLQPLIGSQKKYIRFQRKIF